MKQQDYNTLTECLCCGSDRLANLLDLGMQPLANNYHNGDEGKEYPLALNICKQCCHTQLSVAVNPELMFKHYLYVTGTSKTLRDYCGWFANMCVAENPNGVSVLDIASNDGTQLDAFKMLGLETVGIEPATNLIADQPHHIINDFAENVHMAKQFDIITAQNVMAHTQYPLEILFKIKQWLSKTGTAYIQTSQANMFINGEFDTIYHEHISFYCVRSMTRLLNRVGLHLVDVTKTHIHGESYVFKIKHANGKQQDLEAFDEHRYITKTYKDFGNKTAQTLTKLLWGILKYRKLGYTVIGYGAAAKGMTVLNALRLQTEEKYLIDYIVDDNPLKVNKMTPGTNIPICDSTILKSESRQLIIPLAWNFHNEISQKVANIRGDRDTVYLQYFPVYKENGSIS